MAWDPEQYARYASERDRPFHDLLAQVGAHRPRTVVDLGCGSGRLTASLSERWPNADVRGVDSSPEMVSRAPAGVPLTVGSAEEFDATGVDVVVSNALLQWVPTHRDLLQRWAEQLPAGGWLAFSVPSNFTAASHQLMRELADSPAWTRRLHGVLRGAESVDAPDQYLDLLAGCGLAVEAWQTTYLHLLPGEDPVVAWMRGTGLRPVLAVLPASDAGRFTAQYAALLRKAYPRRPHGTVFPFTRTFVVARTPSGRA